MEERDPPTGGGHPDEPPNLGHDRSHSSFQNTEKPIALTSGQERELSTYVVQIPKDQIYRVPPPENAQFMDRCRNPSIKKKRTFCNRILWILLILAVLVALIAIAVVILYKVFSPKASVFSIVDVHVRSQSHPGYKITLKAKNPNERFGIDYASDGGAWLFFKTNKLATGNFPKLHQEGSNSNTVYVDLTGSDEELPKEIDESMNDNKTDHQVSLMLKMNLKADMNFGFLNLWNKDMNVDCDFKVSTLRASKRILSQKCDSKI